MNAVFLRVLKDELHAGGAFICRLTFDEDDFPFFFKEKVEFWGAAWCMEVEKLFAGLRQRSRNHVFGDGSFVCANVSGKDFIRCVISQLRYQKTGIAKVSLKLRRNQE